MKFLQFWDDQAEWSQKQFGSDAERGPIGSLRHLAKEVEEAIACPNDLTEYSDLFALTIDATRRAGFSPDQLLNACYAKLAVNKTREWSVPTSDDPVTHIKPDMPATLQTQDLINAGLNGFAFELAAESIWAHPNPEAFEFIYRGVLFKCVPVEIPAHLKRKREAKGLT